MDVQIRVGDLVILQSLTVRGMNDSGFVANTLCLVRSDYNGDARSPASR